ncbi:hypothetical protein V1477_018208 [Vespula maculifrons]|uniref:Uncharacterized protein n=1 Tax=Vespula maculifrons TaxID=7453 RepID=A0ABD2B0N2_VESMC
MIILIAQDYLLFMINICSKDRKPNIPEIRKNDYFSMNIENKLLCLHYDKISFGFNLKRYKERMILDVKASTRQSQMYFLLDKFCLSIYA